VHTGLVFPVTAHLSDCEPEAVLGFASRASVPQQEAVSRAVETQGEVEALPVNELAGLSVSRFDGSA
jgi:hypothetical protein